MIHGLLSTMPHLDIDTGSTVLNIALAICTGIVLGTALASISIEFVKWVRS